jgi:hypothetical protein
LLVFGLVVSFFLLGLVWFLFGFCFVVVWLLACLTTNVCNYLSNLYAIIVIIRIVKAL